MNLEQKEFSTGYSNKDKVIRVHSRMLMIDSRVEFTHQINLSEELQRELAGRELQKVLSFLFLKLQNNFGGDAKLKNTNSHDFKNAFRRRGPNFRKLVNVL